MRDTASESISVSRGPSINSTMGDKYKTGDKYSRVRSQDTAATGEEGRNPTDDGRQSSFDIDRAGSVLSATSAFVSLDNSTGKGKKANLDVIAARYKSPSAESTGGIYTDDNSVDSQEVYALLMSHSPTEHNPDDSTVDEIAAAEKTAVEGSAALEAEKELTNKNGTGKAEVTFDKGTKEAAGPMTGIAVSKTASSLGSECDQEYSDSDYSSESDNEENHVDRTNTTTGEVSDDASRDDTVEAKDSKVQELVVNNEVDRTIKNAMSSVSGSDDDSEDDDSEDEDNEDGEETQKKVLLKDGLKNALPIFKKKQQVLMVSKGLKKGAEKVATSKQVQTTKSSKGTTSKKTTSKIMKSTALRLKKNEVKQKGVSQMITIRHKGNHGFDNVIPMATDDNAKLMRVCKLTSKGYVSAEFKSVDPNNTPLHMACLTHYPETFILNYLIKSTDKKSGIKAGIRSLLKKRDDTPAVFKENSCKELPIHYAVMDKLGVPPAVFDALLQEYPESVHHANIDRSLPIHVACEVGAPSLYSIKQLCAASPGSVMMQNDLRVQLYEEGKKEISWEGDNSIFCCNDTFGWFGANGNGKNKENPKIENFETGWTPLHLASMNGAEPEVIEAILETNKNCLLLKTNKGRTPLECAKWIIINALLNDVSVTKLQNTFAAIEIMQSYNYEIKVKHELVHKVGLINAVMENEKSYGGLWKDTVDIMPDLDNEKEAKRMFSSGIGYGEVGLTQLHRAILGRHPPEEVRVILEKSPECMNIASTHNRSPMQCAKHIIIKGLLVGELASSLTNTFVSLEIMQLFDDQRDKDAELDASQALSKSILKDYKESGELMFGSRADNYSYTKKYLQMEYSALGRFVKVDNDAAMQPHEYYPPANLSHVNLRVTIPVGFRRFRKAFLNSKETFLAETVLEDHMGYNK